MSKIRNLIKLLFDSKYRFRYLSGKGFFRKQSDIKYLKKLYYANTGRHLNLDAPKSFNEKLQWLKIYDRDDKYTTMVDKYHAKRYVAKMIGEDHIIPNLGVWDSFDEIDFSKLPQRFVLKCTHDSGGLSICKNRANFNLKNAAKRIKKSLRINYFYRCREWPYKNVRPRIIAEEYMEDGSGEGLMDYKFYCFNGEPKLLYISKGLENHSTASISFVNLDWSFAPYERSDYKSFNELPPKPSCFNEMVDIAKKLSKGIPFIRVDLYQVYGKVFFSELTLTPTGGFIPFKNQQHDFELGKLIHLPIDK